MHYHKTQTFRCIVFAFKLKKVKLYNLVVQNLFYFSGRMEERKKNQNVWVLNENSR